MEGSNTGASGASRSDRGGRHRKRGLLSGPFKGADRDRQRQGGGGGRRRGGGGSGARGRRGGGAPARTMTKDDLDAEIDKHMGRSKPVTTEAVKTDLDADLDAYFAAKPASADADADEAGGDEDEVVPAAADAVAADDAGEQA